MSEAGQSIGNVPSSERYLEKSLTWNENRFSPEPPPASLVEKYILNRDQIIDTYQKVSLWHGTGRMQYRNGKITDILDSLALAKGLKPEKDVWDWKNGETMSTSLTDRRMYASIYAKMHDTVNHELKYEYYPRKFWSNIFLSVTGNLAFKELVPNKGTLKDKIKTGAEFSQMALRFSIEWRKWFKKIMKTPPLKPSLGRVRSDIQGNYPILLGVNNSVNAVPTSQYISAFEIRTNEPVPIINIIYMEVPLSRVQETEDFLTKRGVFIPVIPMELGEIHSSQFTAREHVYSNPFKSK